MDGNRPVTKHSNTIPAFQRACLKILSTLNYSVSQEKLSKGRFTLLITLMIFCLVAAFCSMASIWAVTFWPFAIHMLGLIISVIVSFIEADNYDKKMRSQATDTKLYYSPYRVTAIALTVLGSATIFITILSMFGKSAVGSDTVFSIGAGFCIVSTALQNLLKTIVVTFNATA